MDIAERLVCQWNVPISTLAILTPYAAQKEAIGDEVKHRRRRELQKRIRERGDITIKTITESQGSAFFSYFLSNSVSICYCITGTEYGIVLLSTVRSRRMSADSSEAADEGWIRKHLGFVADHHRICVGITRCKYGLVIVGEH